MARSLFTAFYNALVSESIRPFIAINLAFSGGNFTVWTGIGNITFTGVDSTSRTYIGSGEIITLSPLTENAEVSANGVTVNFNGIDSQLVSSALTEQYQGRDVQIYFGAIDTGTSENTNSFSVVGTTPYLFFRGKMDLMTIADDGERANIGLTCENRLIDFDSNMEHTGSTCTDQKCRIVININYYPFINEVIDE